MRYRVKMLEFPLWFPIVMELVFNKPTTRSLYIKVTAVGSYWSVILINTLLQYYVLVWYIFKQFFQVKGGWTKCTLLPTEITPVFCLSHREMVSSRWLRKSQKTQHINLSPGSYDTIVNNCILLRTCGLSLISKKLTNVSPLCSALSCQSDRCCCKDFKFESKLNVIYSKFLCIFKI